MRNLLTRLGVRKVARHFRLPLRGRLWRVRGRFWRNEGVRRHEEGARGTGCRWLDGDGMLQKIDAPRQLSHTTRESERAFFGLTLLNRSSFNFCSTAARASVTLGVGATGLSGVRAIKGEGEAESTIESCARTRCRAGWSAEREGGVSAPNSSQCDFNDSCSPSSVPDASESTTRSRFRFFLSCLQPSVPRQLAAPKSVLNR